MHTKNGRSIGAGAGGTMRHSPSMVNGSSWPSGASARRRGVVVVSDLREAIQRQAGKKVRLSTVYRMLARHGWRKVAPDTRHPKSDPAAQEAYKKNSRGWWQPPNEAITKD
jgi:transposase